MQQSNRSDASSSDAGHLPPEDIYGHRKKAQFVIEALHEHMKGRDGLINVLDFGCGNGTTISQYVIGPGIDYYGVDEHGPSLKFARDHFGGPQARFVDAVPEGVVFEVIIYADVLEHLKDPAEVLRRHRALLSDDGIVIGAVPNGFGPFEAESWVDRRLGLSDRRQRLDHLYRQIRHALAKWVKTKILRRRLPPSEPPSDPIPYNLESGHIQFFTRDGLFRTLGLGGLTIRQFAHVTFMGAPFTNHYLAGKQRFLDFNARVADVLPHWAVSGWAFVAGIDKPPQPAFTVDEVVTMILRDRRRPPPGLGIRCARVGAVLRRDLIELCLWVSRTGTWSWTGDDGGRSLAQGIFRTVANLAGDAILWPAFYWQHWRAAKKLLQPASSPKAAENADGILYLRTDHVFDQQYGGSATHTAGVITGFRDQGMRVSVVSTDRLKGVPDDDAFCCVEPRYGRGRNIPNMGELAYNDQLLARLRERCDRSPPALIYQRHSRGNYVGAELRRRFQVPFVLEFNGSEIWVARHWAGHPLFHEKLLETVELANLRAADLIVVVSKALKDELVGRGIDKEKILVNPNGVDPDVYHPKVDGTAIRKKLNLTDKTVIGFIGSFGPWHGAEVLAEAFGRLLAKVPDMKSQVRLLMIGEGNTMPQVRRKLDEYNVGDACILMGAIPQEQGPEHLAACDTLVSPHVPNPDGSPFFGSPTKLFEYMAMGKGIIASDMDQIGEILDHGQTAWLVEPKNIEALIDGLQTLVENKLMRDHIGAAARKLVVSRFTWRQHTKRILDALENRYEPGNVEEMTAGQ